MVSNDKQFGLTLSVIFHKNTEGKTPVMKYLIFRAFILFFQDIGVLQVTCF